MESRRLAISSLLSSRPSTPVAPLVVDEIESPLDSLAIAASLVSRGPSAKRQTPSPPSPPAKKPRSDDAQPIYHSYHHQPYIQPDQHYALPPPPPPPLLPQPIQHPIHQPQRFFADPPRPIVPVMVTPAPRLAIPRLGPTEMLNQIKAETEAARSPPHPHRLSPVELRHQIQHEIPIPVLTSHSPELKPERPPLPSPQHTRGPSPPPFQLKSEPEPVPIPVHESAPFHPPTPPPFQPQPQPELKQPLPPPPPIKSEPVPLEPSIDDELMAEIDLAESHAAATAPPPVPPPSKQPSPPPRPPPKPIKTQSKSKSSRTSLTAGKSSTTSKKSKQQRKATPAVPRSRSVSHHPQFDDDEKDHDYDEDEAAITKKKVKAKEKDMVEEDDDSKEDDKLYCLCRTPYDDDIVMIACDRCDEWYHPECVELPEKMIDLVDQFVCPLCRDRNPQWCTTYKARCLQGVASVRPNSPSSCHNPARPPFSKYCSEECGIKNMERKIDAWEFGGARAEEGRIDRLWEAVRSAKKREAVVVAASDPLPTTNGHGATPDPPGVVVVSPVTSVPTTAPPPSSPPPSRETESQLSLLNRRLARLAADTTLHTREMKQVEARQRLLQLAMARAENPEHQTTCAFDFRLVMSGEEWVAWMESPEGVAVLQRGIIGTGVPTEGQDGVGWCRGRRKCERHAGWQKLCAAEVELEKGVKDLALKKLAHKERDVRMRIEAIQPLPVQVNGHASDAMVT